MQKYQDPHIKSDPRKYIERKKDEQPYKPFTERGLKATIKKTKNTALGEDTIHPQKIKNIY